MKEKKKPGIVRDPSRRWGKETFSRYRGCVAYIVSDDADGNPGIGSCFHVGEGVFVTARHVVKGRAITAVGFDDDTTTLALLSDPRDWGAKPHGSVTVTRGPCSMRIRRSI